MYAYIYICNCHLGYSMVIIFVNLLLSIKKKKLLGKAQYLHHVADGVWQVVAQRGHRVEVDHVGRVPVLLAVAGNVLQAVRDGQRVDHQRQEAALGGGALQQRAHLGGAVHLLLPRHAAGGLTVLAVQTSRRTHKQLRPEGNGRHQHPRFPSTSHVAGAVPLIPTCTFLRRCGAPSRARPAPPPAGSWRRDSTS